jgi:hypothetical protein
VPFRTIPETDSRYGLICFDAQGEERRDDPDRSVGDGRMSSRLLETAVTEEVTNIFLFSHGWMGDVPAAVRQYDAWIGAFAGSSLDRKRAEDVFPGFRPLFIGLHWPSLPWGDEEIGDGSFAIEGFCNSGAERPGPDQLFNAYAERLGGKPEVCDALHIIFDEARRDAAPPELSERARDAFLKLNRALGLEANGPAGAPDSDREPFDPDAALRAGDEAAFGGYDIFGGMLGLVRLCSYWTMKKRARSIGETGMHSFVNALQKATAARKTRIHLMGHSFGCVVVSSILAGPSGDGSFDRPIDSVVLAQGALSLWSFAPSIPFPGAGAGYFHRVTREGRIRGPLVTTRSRYDTAVGVQYPRACVISGEPSFDVTELPKYGAVGTFGLQGVAEQTKTDCELLPADGAYEFQPGRIYNLEASRYIAKGSGSSGAHNDIAGPEVAHAIWQAAFGSVQRAEIDSGS